MTTRQIPVFKREGSKLIFVDTVTLTERVMPHRVIGHVVKDFETLEHDDEISLQRKFATLVGRAEQPHSDWDCDSARTFYKPRTWKVWRRNQHRAVAI